MSATTYLFTTTKYALYALAVPTTLVLLAGAWFLLGAAWTMFSVHVTGTDRYAHMPRPQHKDPKMAMILGDFGEIRSSPPNAAHMRWGKELKSNVFVYRGLFYSPRVWLGDSHAMNHILGAANSYDFPKPAGLRRFLKSLLGEGVLVAEGDVHKRQRKIIQPAFSVSAIRDLTPVFFKHANRLTDILADFTDRATQSDTPQIVFQSTQAAKVSRKGAPVLDISSWLSRTTLDIIGEAGFAHDFGSVDEVEGTGSADEVASAFNTMMKATAEVTLLQFVQISLSNIPGFLWIRSLPSKRQATINRTYKVLEATSQKIINAKRDVIKKEMAEAVGAAPETETSFNKAQLEEAGLSGTKDLLHLMLKANLASDVKPSEKLSDAELLGQLTTLILAGHETTQTQLTWCLWVLGSRPKVQDRLRAELVEYFAGRDQLDYDALNGLAYLDKVTKEIMRFISPVIQTNRVVGADCSVPLSKPYRTRDGKKTFQSVPLKKGQEIFIPIQYLNCCEDIWGPTAGEFDPDRWDDIPRLVKETGFPQHLLTFIEGPRGCVGNRFAITEFKAILASLLQKLRFEDIEGWEVEPKQGIVVRPRIKGQEELGMQMPLRISRV